MQDHCSKINNIIVFTDGSANHKNRLGGMGVYIIIKDEIELFFNQGYSDTSVGRMELRAAITALQKILDKNSFVTLYSDSQYVVNCIKEGWINKWKRTNFRGLKNIDLLEILYHELLKFRLTPTFVHIKGHTKKEDPISLGNAIVDRLADYKNFENRIYDGNNNIV
jgi:ribonuclease HI